MDKDDLLALGRARVFAASGAARRLRLESGIRQSEVARAVGVSRSVMNHWEAGRRKPSGEAGARYGRFLNGLLEAGS